MKWKKKVLFIDVNLFQFCDVVRHLLNASNFVEIHQFTRFMERKSSMIGDGDDGYQGNS